ncbi:MAG TPA: sigma-54 dependent transcriptional regulator [Thermodesulfobacteriota bacterium]|nr:sigma-54 dependent transcriptional regulator [Thermodesulfobacteriota bacterium]
MNIVSATVLIIDNDEHLSKQLEPVLLQEGYRVIFSSTGKDGIEYARKENPDVVLLCLKLADLNGLEVFKSIDNLEPKPTTIIMTDQGDIQEAVSAIKMGVYDFMEKPISIDKLKVTIMNALSSALTAAAEKEQEKYGFNSLIGRSKAIQDVICLFHNLVSTDCKTILITGESGTGKGLAARLLHFNGARAEKPFIELNCAAIPETLLESELFGYEAGAFTDAKKTKKGILELADKGTIFMDEIGDMSLTLQAKLVKVIEERRFRRIGGTSEISVDARVIAATNRDLKELIRENLFRSDLYHRLNVISFEMPSLLKRKEDIPLLTDYFTEIFRQELHKNTIFIPEEVRELFLRYHWPGNVRELRSMIERAMILSENGILNPKYIKLEEWKGSNVKVEKSGNKIILEIPLEDASLQRIEEKIIRKALDLNKWNQTKTAAMLKMRREALIHRMKKMGLHY